MLQLARTALTLALATLATASLAQAESLTTNATPNDSNHGNSFDVQTMDSAIQITSLDVSLLAGQTTDLAFYFRPGSAAGHYYDSAGWTLLASATNVTSSGTNVPTPFDVPDFILAPDSTYGFYITSTNPAVSLQDTNAGDTPIRSIAGIDDNLRILIGAGVDYPFQSNDSPNPSIWNGTIHYTVPEPASLGLIAIGSLALLRRRR